MFDYSSFHKNGVASSIVSASTGSWTYNFLRNFVKSVTSVEETSSSFSRGNFLSGGRGGKKKKKKRNNISNIRIK